MSVSQKIREYIAKQPQPDDLDYVPIDLNKVAEAVGSSRTKVSSHMAAMASVGRLETVHGQPPPTGGRPPIVGYRNLNMEGKKPAKKQITSIAPAVAEPKPVRKLVQTPELDRVSAARSAMAEFVKQFGGMVDEARAAEAISIDPTKADAYVEEGLSLIQRNAYLEQRNRELHERVTQLDRELGFLRLSKNSELREGLKTAGVTHGD